MAGRPPKYNEELAASICRALEKGVSRTIAAEAHGIDRGTFPVWLERYPAFSRMVKKAEADAATLYVEDITFAARKGNWTAAAWWLERKYPDDYRKPPEDHHHTVTATSKAYIVDDRGETVADKV